MPLAPALDTVGVIARHVEDLALTLGFLAGPDPRDPASSTLPVPDYVARLGDPVQGLRIGVDEAVVGEAHPQVQRMVDQVAGILVKLGLTRASCRFPDWQTLDHLVQLVQLPDASAAHSAYPAHASGRLRAPGARPRRGRAFHPGGRPHDGAARAGHVPRAHAE